MTEERKKELAEYRQKTLAEDTNRLQMGELVDGIAAIQYKLANAIAKEPVPETVKAGGRVVANVAVKRCM